MLTLRIMIVLSILCIINIAFGGEVNENGAENSNKPNTTTLYPVKNVPFYFKEANVHENVTNIEKESRDEERDVATSKHNKHTDPDPNQFKQTYNKIHTDEVVLKSNESKISDTNGNKEIPNREAKITSVRFKEGTTWKIDATYAPSKAVDGAHDESRDGETKDRLKDFKPSPHLGSFYDEDSFVVPTPATEGSFTPYKPPSFESLSFEKDFYKLNYKRPVDSYQTPIDTPYKFETVPRTADWHTGSGLEPRPTEPSMKIPAGGLYKLPDAFQEKPNSDGDNKDFGLEFKDQKDNPLNKRGNPWKGFLHMVTALLPVGLIVSALTPSVITLDNTENNNPYYPSRISRRSDESFSTPPRISERCKRRLLCELHADQNYINFSQRKPCYKLPCEDPHTMSAVLRWLLDHHHPGHHTPVYRPADHDRRGYITGI